MRSAPLLSAPPPTQKADPNCPRHGIEPEGVEVDMGNEFNRQKVMAGALAATLMLSVCSCSKDTTPDPSVSPTVGIEQPVEPSPTVDTTVSPDNEAVDDGDWVIPEGDDSWPAGWEKVVPEGITFPAQTDANYEFSDEPQGRAEQWLFDQWPELWEQGVRSISDSKMTPGITRDASATPAALIQYINGERAEGTEEIPLGFRGQATDINKFPTDAFPNRMASFKDPQAPSQGATGRGGYGVFIQEHYGGKRGEVITASMQIYGYETGFGSKDAGGGNRRNFDTWEDAWAFIEENGFQPSTKGARELYPGEIAAVMVMQENAKSMDVVLLNPETGEWEVAVSYKHPN